MAIPLVHPQVQALISRIPPALTLPAFLFLVMDVGFSVYVLRRDKTTDALLWYRHLPARGPQQSIEK